MLDTPVVLTSRVVRGSWDCNWRRIAIRNNKLADGGVFLAATIGFAVPIESGA